MRRDARAALTDREKPAEIGLSAGRSSTASFGGLDGGGCSCAKTVSRNTKQASDALIAPVFGEIGSVKAVGFRFLRVLSVEFRAINVPGES